jgi:hypothetical protein
MAEIEPRTRLRQALAARALDQLFQIAGTDPRGRPGEADQDDDAEAEPPWRK